MENIKANGSLGKNLRRFELFFSVVSFFFWTGVVVWLANGLRLSHVWNSSNRVVVLIVIILGGVLILVSAIQSLFLWLEAYEIEVNDHEFRVHFYHRDVRTFHFSNYVKFRRARLFRCDSPVGSEMAVLTFFNVLPIFTVIENRIDAQKLTTLLRGK